MPLSIDKEPPSKPILLIDADLNVYKTLVENEREIQWDEDTWTITSDLAVAKESLRSQFQVLAEATGATEVYICLSGASNWRKALYPDYKANRKARPPIGIQPIRLWLHENFETVSRPSLEADDCIGIMATNPDYAERSVIVSADKDLNQIPGWHYDQAQSSFRYVSVESATRFHLYQTLVGDTADNYPGAAGIGPIKANRILDTGKGWIGIIEAFAGDSEAALLMARISRIVRYEEWDTVKKQVILWSPQLNLVSNETVPSVESAEISSSPSTDTTSSIASVGTSPLTEEKITSEDYSLRLVV